MHKTEFLVPDTRHPTRSRSVSPAVQSSPSPLAVPLLSSSPRGFGSGSHKFPRFIVSERKKMFEPEGGGGKGRERESLIPPPSSSSSLEHTDFTDRFSGKRRHSAKDRFSTRGSSFRAKKLRPEPGAGDVGGHHGPPQTRHKQQASVSSIVLPPLWQRLRNFGHHDLQSATMERYTSGKGGGSGRDRLTRKKPTGASAAHLNAAGGEAALETLQNDLLPVCPAFRNEIGGDADWTGVHPHNNEGANLLISLRHSLSHDKQMRVCSRAKMILEGTVPPRDPVVTGQQIHRQVLQIQQPQSTIHFPFEFIDYGSFYYRNHFYQQDHQNFFGVDEGNGPLAISLKREKVVEEIAEFFDIATTGGGLQAPPPKHQYRVIVRTSELETLRGTILEDSIPSGTKTGTSKGLPPREVIDYISQGEFHVGCLKVGKLEKKVCQELMRLDEQELNNRYKVGVLYCKSGQTNEEEMYNNECGSPAFEEFLQTVGQKVTMKGFTKYRAQLDNKTDTTGTHSVYTEYQGSEVMFHVSTYLPHTPSNSQQLLRKRHIGNDIVTVIFQEPGCAPFSPKVIRSHFQHIFVVVRVENPGTEYTKYRVAVTRSQDVPYFGPPIPEGGLFDKNAHFREFFLTKLINACNASLRSEKFSTMSTRTRRQYLLDLCENSCSNITIDQVNTSGLVGLLSKNWGGKKKEKPHLLQTSLVYTPGALVWNVAIVTREGKPLPFSEEHDTMMDCMLVLSPDLMSFVYTNTRDNILHIPTKDISGWVQDEKRINLFYDGTHCLSLEVYEQDDAMEITSRLLTLAPSVTASHEATLMEFQRSQGALLGFSINEVCEVLRVSGQAKQIGLQIKARILQVEDKLVCNHKHSHIIDILTDRRKADIRAYVIPPVPPTQRSLLYYPPVNWGEVWANRPTYMNGDTEDQTPQNGTEPMETENVSGGGGLGLGVGVGGGGGGGSVALRDRGKRRAATVHGTRPHRSSYHEALQSEEISPQDEMPFDDDEPIYDRLRSDERGGGLSPTNLPRPHTVRARSPKPGRGDHSGFTRVRSRAQGGGRDHVPAQQIAENIRATERALSAGPSPEPLEHKLDYYTSHVPTHISTSTFLPNSTPHTAAPLSSLRRKNSDKVMIEIMDPKSPTSSTGACPPTPGSVQELAKKFSFNSPPPSNKSSPSRTSGGGSAGGGAKIQATPMKATLAASEMTRSGIPVPAHSLSPNREGTGVQVRGKPRSPKMRPASWDASLIYDGDREDRSAGRPGSREEGESGRQQFSRKENGRLPIRKKQTEEERERGESEEPIPSGELSQKELVSVRERTQRWEERGSDLPSFFTLPKSFRTKGGSGAAGRPQSPNSPISPSAGSRIPAPRSSVSSQTALTQSMKARNMYSKQSTPPIQEESDGQEEPIYNRLSEKTPSSGEADKRDRTSSLFTGSYPGGSTGGGRGGGVSQMRGRAGRAIGTRSMSSSQVIPSRERQLSPQRQTSPLRQISPVGQQERQMSPTGQRQFSAGQQARQVSPVGGRGERPVGGRGERPMSPVGGRGERQMGGRGERQMSPPGRQTSPPGRATSPTMRTTVLAARRSPSPTSGGSSKIPTPSSRKLTRSPPPQGGQISSRPPRGNPLDDVVLESASALTSLSLSENKPISSNKKVENWLRQSSSVTTKTPVSTETSLPGKQGLSRMDQYRKNSYSRNVVKTAMI